MIVYSEGVLVHPGDVCYQRLRHNWGRIQANAPPIRGAWRTVSDNPLFLVISGPGKDNYKLREDLIAAVEKDIEEHSS